MAAAMAGYRPPTGQVDATDAAQECMRQAREVNPESEMEAIAAELEVKAARFQAALAGDALARLGWLPLRGLLRTIFATRRKASQVLDTIGAETLAAELHELLYGRQPLPLRIDRFDAALGAIEPAWRRDVAGEVLHFTSPDRHWLWTRWMWDPDIKTGALPLVTMQDFDLEAASPGATYLRVGQAVAFVNETGRAIGFTRFGSEAFGVDVYLACVYGVYLYTITRMRMTQEFNKVIPPLPQLARRLLGTHRMELM